LFTNYLKKKPSIALRSMQSLRPFNCGKFGQLGLGRLVVNQIHEDRSIILARRPTVRAS
jgi:hypothetical protein